MLLTKSLEITVNSKTYQHYKNKGYIFNRVKDKIIVKIEDLSLYSQEKIQIQCDYCQRIYTIKYCDYLRTSKKNTLKDACKYCKYRKTMDTVEKKYGVNNVFKLPETQNKVRETLLRKYGVYNISMLPTTQEKIKNNNIKKYGVYSTSQLQTIKNKIIMTNMKKYGVKNFLCLEYIRKKGYKFNNTLQAKQKRQITCLNKYGVRNSFLLPEVRQKIAKNMGVSSQQRQLWKYIGGILNFPFKNFYIDIGFPEEKIAVEYDGGGHDLAVKLGNITQQQFSRNEKFREKTLFDNNWRIIRFISPKNLMLSETEVLHYYFLALYLLKQGRHKIKIYIDTKTIQ